MNRTSWGAPPMGNPRAVAAVAAGYLLAVPGTPARRPSATAPLPGHKHACWATAGCTQRPAESHPRLPSGDITLSRKVAHGNPGHHHPAPARRRTLRPDETAVTGHTTHLPGATITIVAAGRQPRSERVSLTGAANTVPARLRAPAQPCRTPSPRPSHGGQAPPGPAATLHARLCAGPRAQHRRNGTTARPVGRVRARCQR